VVRLGALRRFVAGTEETRSAVTIVDQASCERPAVPPRAPDLVFAIESAFDVLLDLRYHRPLLVLGRILVQAHVHTVSEVGIVQNVGSDDPIDVMVLVGSQPEIGRASCRERVGSWGWGGMVW